MKERAALAMLVAMVAGGLTACSGAKGSASGERDASISKGLVSLTLSALDADGNDYTVDAAELRVSGVDGEVVFETPAMDVRHLGSVAPLTFELPPAGDYMLRASAQGHADVDTDGDGEAERVAAACEAALTFDVSSERTTQLHLTLHCPVPVPEATTGEAAITLAFVGQQNRPCGITGLIAGPTGVSLGRIVNLSAKASHGVSYRWSAKPRSAGKFSAPRAPATTFRCDAVGSATLTLSIENASEQCEDQADVEIVCFESRCGNDIAERDEQCDGSDTPQGKECSGDCLFVSCGDRVVEGSETCDDGNLSSEDGCSSECQREHCGDDVVQAGLGETCDPPGERRVGTLCRGDCTHVVPDCETCTRDHCASEEAACADPDNRGRCVDLLECLEQTKCADGATTHPASVVMPCLCGTYSAIDCASGRGDGPCLAVAREAATRGGDPSSLQQALIRFDDVGYALGDAKRLVMCQIAECRVSCGQY